MESEFATYISRAHDAADLLHGVEIRAQATVHGEDLLIDDRGDGQAVEAISEGLPKLDIVPPLAFVVEAIDPIDRGTLVVSTKDEEVLGILDLVGQQQADRLERLLPTVDIVSEEQIVGFRWETAVLEQT